MVVSWGEKRKSAPVGYLSPSRVPLHQGKRWLISCQNDHVYLGRKMLNEIGERLMKTRIHDLLIVIQDEDAIALAVRKIIEKECQW